jgi:hypothetical protein
MRHHTWLFNSGFNISCGCPFLWVISGCHIAQLQGEGYHPHNNVCPWAAEDMTLRGAFFPRTVFAETSFSPRCYRLKSIQTLLMCSDTFCEFLWKRRFM